MPKRLGGAAGIAVGFAMIGLLPTGVAAGDVWRVVDGQTVMTFHTVGTGQAVVDSSSADPSVRIRHADTDTSFEFTVAPSTDLQFEYDQGRLSGARGRLRHAAGLTLRAPGGQLSLPALELVPGSQGGVLDSLSVAGTNLELLFRAVSVSFDPPSGILAISSDAVTVSPKWAAALGLPPSAGGVVGSAVVRVRVVRAALDASVVNVDRADTASTLSTALAPIGPDIIVGDLQGIMSYGTEAGIAAFAVGTTSCNRGDEPAMWVASTPDHPVIAQTMYRLMDNRFEQIGLSWVKHGFAALAEDICNLGCQNPGRSDRLGVGCSDPYGSFLNGRQDILGPHSQVNPHTGVIVFPRDLVDPSCSTCDRVQRRLQVSVADLDPTLNPGASYFVEGQYVSRDDAEAGNGNNNKSYRPIRFEDPTLGCFGLTPGEFCAVLDGTTAREKPAIEAWVDSDPTVLETPVQVPGEGLFILAAKVIDRGGGTWEYEYALQNINSDRAAGSFSIPLPATFTLLGSGFHDVDHHSGEIYDTTDWVAATGVQSITWSTQTEAENVNANALRWDTLYNFRFTVDIPPDNTRATIGLFKSGFPAQVTAATLGPTPGPMDCNGNGITDFCDIDCSQPGCPVGCLTIPDCDSNGVPDDCQPDCNGNGLADECDLATGVSSDCNGNLVPDECEPDCNGNGIPDDCEPPSDCDNDGVTDCLDLCQCSTVVKCVCPPTGECCFPTGICLPDFPATACVDQGGTPDCIAANCVSGCACPSPSAPGPDLIRDARGLTVVSTKNRVVSFVAGDSGRAQAIEVTVVSLPPPYDVFNGQVLWVGQPRFVSELPGKNDATPPVFTAATLQCQPHFIDWSAWGTINVAHRIIVPGATLEIRVVEPDCAQGDPQASSLPLTLSTSSFGDVAGAFSTGNNMWPAPDGTIDISIDAIAVLDKFRSLPQAPDKVRVDLEPATLDFLINITDVLQTTDAFRGLAYPFPPGPQPCP